MKKWQDIWHAVNKGGTFHNEARYYLYWNSDNRILSFKSYKSLEDAKRGATMRFKHLMRQVEKDLIDG